MTPACLSSAEIRQFLEGSLPADTERLAAEHLKRCEHCGRVRDDLCGAQDLHVYQRLAHANAASSQAADDQAARRLCERLRRPAASRDATKLPNPAARRRRERSLDVAAAEDAAQPLADRPQFEKEAFTIGALSAVLARSPLTAARPALDLLQSLSGPDQPVTLEEWTSLLVARGVFTDFQVRTLLLGRGGDLSCGEYEILEPLGRGGMRVVFKARHRRMQRLVALKKLKSDGARNSSARERFRRETRLIAQLRHPNIVIAHDAGQVGGVPFLVMEYIDGQNLDVLTRRAGRLPVRTAVEYVRQTAQGLRYAHDMHVVHRDIKPSNLMLDRQGTVKILDLGLARIDDLLRAHGEETSLTDWNSVIGTLDYMAPEQAENTRRADHRSDIYALGCTLFRMASGRAVYPADSIVGKLAAHREQPVPRLTDACPDAPPALAAIFTRMVAKQPADRYQSVAELLRELDGLELPATGDSAFRITFAEDGPGANSVPADSTAVPTATGVSRVPSIPGQPPHDSQPPALAALRAETTDFQNSHFPWPQFQTLGSYPRSTSLALLICLLIGLGVWRAPTATPPIQQATSTKPESEISVDARRHDVANQAQAPVSHPIFSKIGPGGAAQAHDESIGRLVTESRHAYGAAIVDGGRMALTAGDGESLSFWTLPRRELVRRNLVPTGVRQVSVTAYGTQALTLSLDGTVRVWDVAAGGVLHVYPFPPDTVRSATLSPDGSRFLTGEKGGATGVWNVTSGKPMGKLVGPTGDILGVAVSADNAHAAAASLDGTLGYWRLADQELQHSFRGHAGWVTAVAFLPGSRCVVSGGLDRSVRLWDTQDLREVRRFESHEMIVRSVAASHDGQRLLSASDDGTLCLWQTSNGALLHRFVGHAGTVWSAAISPDGETAISGGEDGSCRLWQLTPPFGVPDIPAAR